MIIVDVTIMIVGSSIIVDMIYDYNDVEAADVVFFFLAPKWEYDS